MSEDRIKPAVNLDRVAEAEQSDEGLGSWARSTGTEGAKKNVLHRHPLLFGTVAIAIAASVLMPKSPAYQKLDYTKPIYTRDYAIICPQSLFFDIRADHDANAIFDVFTAFTGRDEKAKALGCDVVRGDIPVTAERMLSPFDTYVSVHFAGIQGEFFTMEGGNLKNGVLQEVASQTSDTPDTPGPPAQETIESEFEKRLPTLEEPMPNLRWLPIPTLNPRPDKLEDAELVTPYGPCVEIIGNAKRTGYVVLKSNTTEFLGGYDTSRAAAKKTAEEYCHEWYSDEASKHQNSSQTDHMWFKPDSEERSEPAAEIMRAIPESDSTPPVESSSQAAAPVTPTAQPSAPPEHFTWQTEPNGDEVLIGSSGQCATLALLSAQPQ